MGTSSIGFIKIGTTGPTGPTGNTGLRGATGTGTGKTGITGPAGFYVAAVNGFIDPITASLSDDTIFEIFGTKGPTGFTGTIFGSNGITGLSLYSGFSGYTLNVRGLTFIGNLQAQISGNSIVVTPLDVSYGVTLASTVQDSTVIYAKTDNTLDSTRIVYGKTYGDFSFSNIAGITENSTYLNVNTNVSEIFGGNNVILGITNFGIYKIHTPIGLSGFTLDPTGYNDNELISVTLFIEGNGFSQFPSNVYFSDSPYSSYFGCGTNIMNVMTPDKGTNWYATIVERGYGVTRCNQMEGIGSCCYLEGNTLTCTEYVTEDWCSEKTGTYNAFTPCDSACGVTSICCSNGNCVSGVSESECIYFGGKYYSRITCDGNDYTDQPNTERQCYRSDLEPTSCCTGGQCIPDVTHQICINYYHGVPFTGTCCELNCNANPPRRISGACCIESGSTCSEMTPAECSSVNGIFFGDGITCGQINCCFPSPDDIGSCCLSGVTCSITTRANCNVSNNYIFTKDGTCDGCVVIPADLKRGICCGLTQTFTDITKEECLAYNENNYFFPNLVFNHRPDVVYEWKSDGPIDPNNPSLGETGGDCIFCRMARKVYTNRHYVEYVGPDPLFQEKNICINCTYNKPRFLIPEDPAGLMLDPSIDFTNKHKIVGTEIDISKFKSTATLRNLEDQSKKNTKMTPNCGVGEHYFVDFPVEGIGSTLETIANFYDAFSMGHIFAYRLDNDPVKSIKPDIPENPNREELQDFIYNKYLTYVKYVYLDYAIKVCRSQTSQTELYPFDALERCFYSCQIEPSDPNQSQKCCNSSNCLETGHLYCSFMKELAFSAWYPSSCNYACNVFTCPETTSGTDYVQNDPFYCRGIYPILDPAQGTRLNNNGTDPYFGEVLSPCEDQEPSISGDRCTGTSAMNPCSECTSVDCINDPSNPCYNLQDCPQT